MGRKLENDELGIMEGCWREEWCGSYIGEKRRKVDRLEGQNKE